METEAHQSCWFHRERHRLMSPPHASRHPTQPRTFRRTTTLVRSRGIKASARQRRHLGPQAPKPAIPTSSQVNAQRPQAILAIPSTPILFMTRRLTSVPRSTASPQDLGLMRTAMQSGPQLHHCRVRVCPRRGVSTRALRASLLVLEAAPFLRLSRQVRKSITSAPHLLHLFPLSLHQRSTLLDPSTLPPLAQVGAQQE